MYIYIYIYVHLYIYICISTYVKPIQNNGHSRHKWFVWCIIAIGGWDGNIFETKKNRCLIPSKIHFGCNMIQYIILQPKQILLQYCTTVTNYYLTHLKINHNHHPIFLYFQPELWQHRFRCVHFKNYKSLLWYT
jgi:hypothetical protein